MAFLTTRSPIGNLFNLHSEMGRTFEDLFESREGRTDAGDTPWRPSVDISETDNSFEVRAELPGVTESDVHVSVIDNVLTIKGEKRQEAETEDKNYHRVERRYGSFQRTFTLPRNVESTAITAKFGDGVLRVTIPKAEEAKQTHIPITVKS